MEVDLDFCEGQKLCAQRSEASKSSSRRPSRLLQNRCRIPLLVDR
jgi:hypothetical protein